MRSDENADPKQDLMFCISYKFPGHYTIVTVQSLDSRNQGLYESTDSHIPSQLDEIQFFKGERHMEIHVFTRYL